MKKAQLGAIVKGIKAISKATKTGVKTGAKVYKETKAAKAAEKYKPYAREIDFVEAQAKHNPQVLKDYNRTQANKLKLKAMGAATAGVAGMKYLDNKEKVKANKAKVNANKKKVQANTIKYKKK